MFYYIHTLVLALFLSVALASVGKAASFDCNKATTETEIAICADSELSALDDRMGKLWITIGLSETKFEEQRAWLAQRDAGASKVLQLASKLGRDPEYSLIKFLRDFYNHRNVQLVTGCKVEVDLLDLFDNVYPLEELNSILEASDTLENCIDDHYQSISGDFEAISNSLSILPEDCVIVVEAFMYPISTRVGHSVYSRCQINFLNRYQILHTAMLDLIDKKNTNSNAALDADQRNWMLFSEASCGFFSDWGLHSIERVAPKHCKLNVLKFRLLYLSPFIGIDDVSGWPASSIDELLGPSYGLN
ncbi:lysozyme inhibitor LprI family protein [Celeribacter marinus]|uniref:lysozyme inhibitor LprI family protein n=1 Tax=Celeribacter marinus TaxID=1397108 RepID=UPI00316E768C